MVGTVISVSLAQSQHGSVLFGDGEMPRALPRRQVRPRKIPLSITRWHSRLNTVLDTALVLLEIYLPPIFFFFFYSQEGILIFLLTQTLVCVNKP